MAKRLASILLVPANSEQSKVCGPYLDVLARVVIVVVVVVSVVRMVPVDLPNKNGSGRRQARSAQVGLKYTRKDNKKDPSICTRVKRM